MNEAKKIFVFWEGAARNALLEFNVDTYDPNAHRWTAVLEGVLAMRRRLQEALAGAGSGAVCGHPVCPTRLKGVRYLQFPPISTISLRSPNINPPR